MPSTSNPVGGVCERLRTPVFLPRANRRFHIICHTQLSLCTSPSGTAARAGDVNIRPWQAFLARGALGDIQKIGHCYSTRFLFITIFIPSTPPPSPSPILIPFYSNLSKIAAREEGITNQLMILYGGGGWSNCLQGFPLQSRRDGRGN
jgi:hypothetical protein